MENVAVSTARSEFDLSMAKELKDVSVSSAIADMNQKQAGAAQGWTKANREVVQYELDKALFDNKIKLSSEEYLKTLESVRQLQQDNDINAFRYRMERLLGTGSNSLTMIRDLLLRLGTALGDRATFDRLFNPK
jgi:hypothetical protein